MATALPVQEAGNLRWIRMTTLDKHMSWKMYKHAGTKWAAVMGPLTALIALISACSPQSLAPRTSTGRVSTEPAPLADAHTATPEPSTRRPGDLALPTEPEFVNTEWATQGDSSTAPVIVSWQTISPDGLWLAEVRYELIDSDIHIQFTVKKTMAQSNGPSLTKLNRGVLGNGCPMQIAGPGMVVYYTFPIHPWRMAVHCSQLSMTCTAWT